MADADPCKPGCSFPHRPPHAPEHLPNCGNAPARERAFFVLIPYVHGDVATWQLVDKLTAILCPPGDT